jgi:hypothetical protein
VTVGIPLALEPERARDQDTPLLALGLAAWVVALAVLPAPLPGRILLLAPLVILPRLVTLLPERQPIARVPAWAVPAAAAPLLGAFALPAGPAAAALAVPWLVIGALAGVSGVAHGLRHLPSILAPRRIADLGIDVALGFWAVAAAFIVVDRLGVATPFPPVIVLLTAVHFHFAGVGLLSIAALLAATTPWLRAAVVGLVVGIPVTALGFVVAIPAIGAAGALLVGSSGLGVAVALLLGATPGPGRWAGRFAGACLLVGMPMGIAWAFATLASVAFVDLEVMIRTHGALNALAVLTVVLGSRRSRR